MSDIFAFWGESPTPATYTDEPAPKKDVAPGWSFSRFNLLTKITVFAFPRYPAADVSQDSCYQYLGK